MFNRYVDGLGTSLPADPLDYEASGVRLAEIGYVRTCGRGGVGPFARPNSPIKVIDEFWQIAEPN
jgi:hypothetical protein